MGYVEPQKQVFMLPEQTISLLKRTLWLVGMSALLFAAYWSVRLAVADYFYRENTISSLSRAVALAGGDAEYHALLAEHLEGIGTDPDPQFLIAASLSPEDSRYWIRLGFSAESKGDYRAAERYLLQAASVNRKFDPAWALMNFYFRRGEADQFWRWADKALAMSYGDLSAIYRLFWSMSTDARLIRSHVPAKPQALASYLSFLEAENRGEAATETSRALAEIAGLEQVPILLDYCDRSLDSHADSAVAVWDTLCLRKLLPLRALEPAQGRIIGDPEFTRFPRREAFDWLAIRNDEIAIGTADDSHGIHVRLSGNEPEDCVLMETTAPVRPGTRYRIIFDVKYDPDAVLEGVAWQVFAPGRAGGALAASDFAKGGNAAPLEFACMASPVRLRLTYRRPVGTIRAKGGFTILSVRSEIAP